MLSHILLVVCITKNILSPHIIIKLDGVRGEYGNYKQFFNNNNEFINLTRPS